MEPRWLSHHSPARLLVCLWHDNFVSESLSSSRVSLSPRDSIIIPWFTIREVKVDVEIVRILTFSECFWPNDLQIEYSHHRKSLSSVSNAVCSKVSWRELAEVLSWSTTHLELSRASFRLAGHGWASFLMMSPPSAKACMRRNFTLSAVFREISRSHSWINHLLIYGHDSSK